MRDNTGIKDILFKYASQLNEVGTKLTEKDLGWLVSIVKREATFEDILYLLAQEGGELEQFRAWILMQRWERERFALPEVVYDYLDNLIELRYPDEKKQTIFRSIGQEKFFRDKWSHESEPKENKAIEEQFVEFYEKPIDQIVLDKEDYITVDLEFETELYDKISLAATDRGITNGEYVEDVIRRFLKALDDMKL